MKKKLIKTILQMLAVTIAWSGIFILACVKAGIYVIG